MDEFSQDKERREIRRSLNTPAGYIVIWAFNYASVGLDVIDQRSPQISGWPNGRMLGNLLQVATIFSALLRIERARGLQDYSAFHSGIVKDIAPSVREIYVPPLQTLAAFLLAADRSSFALEEIPPLSKLFAEDEERVANSVGLWLVLTLKQVSSLSEQSDVQVAAGLANVVETWAKLIAEHVLTDRDLSSGIS